MVEGIIGMYDMGLIFQVTDAMGIDRESISVPLGKEDPGAVRKLPTGGVGGERGDAQVVAEKIYDAVNDKEPKLRYLVGQDAEMIDGLRRQLDDEQFEKTIRQALDFWD